MEQQLHPRLCTSVEEWEYNTVPGSVAATRAALSYSTAQTNPTVKRGISCKQTKVKKLPKEKAKINLLKQIQKTSKFVFTVGILTLLHIETILINIYIVISFY